MFFTYADQLLSREQVIAEATARAKRLDLNSADEFSLRAVVAEVINDPEDVLNHQLPEGGEESLSIRRSYYRLLANEVANNI